MTLPLFLYSGTGYFCIVYIVKGFFMLQLNQDGTVTNIFINLGHCPIWNLRRNRNEGSAQSFPEFIRMQCVCCNRYFSSSLFTFFSYSSDVECLLQQVFPTQWNLNFRLSTSFHRARIENGFPAEVRKKTLLVFSKF